MHRRQFLGLSGLALLGQAVKAQCVQLRPGVFGCHTSLSVPQIILAATLQQCPEWCWAASLSAVFKFFNHPLDQKKIVLDNYHQLVCMPALSATQIAADANRGWVDDFGQNFRSRITAAYDAQAGVLAINNAIIVNEVLHGRPLLYCNRSHCMVICGVYYRPSNWGPLIDRVDVMDPWPYSPRLHPLNLAELRPVHQDGQMMFVASVNVTSD